MKAVSFILPLVPRISQSKILPGILSKNVPENMWEIHYFTSVFNAFIRVFPTVPRIEDPRSCTMRRSAGCHWMLLGIV